MRSGSLELHITCARTGYILARTRAVYRGTNWGGSSCGMLCGYADDITMMDSAQTNSHGERIIAELPPRLILEPDFFAYSHLIFQSEGRPRFYFITPSIIEKRPIKCR